eukprot:365255-Chlamydomonas_euryale.AAC.7
MPLSSTQKWSLSNPPVNLAGHHVWAQLTVLYRCVYLCQHAECRMPNIRPGMARRRGVVYAFGNDELQRLCGTSWELHHCLFKGPKYVYTVELGEIGGLGMGWPKIGGGCYRCTIKTA